MAGVAARAAAYLGALGIVGLAVLPPEHVHLGADHDDHAGPEVHRHFQPHQRATIETHVESPDEDATYISEPFVVPLAVSADAPDERSLELAPVPDVQPRLAAWHPSARDLRVHDPPWAHAHPLRGPPSQLA